MVGDVDDVLDLGDHFEDGHLNPLAERDRGHPTSLAATTEVQIDGVALDSDELNHSAVTGNRRIDALLEHLGDPLGDVARELDIALGNVGRRRVGIVEYETLFEKVAVAIKSGSADLVGVGLLQHHRQIAVALHDVFGTGLIGGLKPHVVGVARSSCSGYYQPQRQALAAGFAGEHFEELGLGLVADRDEVGGGVGIGHGMFLGRDPGRGCVGEAGGYGHDRTMAKVLLLLPAGTYRTSDFMDAAGSLDLDVVVVTDAPASPMADGDTVIEVDFSQPRVAAGKILSALGENPEVAAVVAVDDVGVLTASFTRQLLGLPGNSPEAVAITRDKATMRVRLAEAGVRQPKFRIVGQGPGPGPRTGGEGGGKNSELLVAARSVGYPCVVKPVGLSGSRGVIRVDNPEELTDAADRARAVAATAEAAAGGTGGTSETSTNGSDSVLVVESYVEGAEVAVEGMVDSGVFTPLAVFDKPDASSGPYFEETYYVTPSQMGSDLIDEINRSVAAATSSIGIVEGPVHAEARVDADGNIWILELAARSIGGLCSRSLRFGLGVSLETLILRHALHMPSSDLTRESAASGVLMLPIPAEGILESVDGQDDARSVFGIQSLEITIPPGRMVRPLPDGDRYLGFMFARGASPEAVESTLREAHSRLNVVISPVPTPS